MKLAHTSLPSRAGFTVLEILVAMAILLMGVTSVLGLLTFGAALTRNASLRAQSAAAVEAVAAHLEEQLFPIVRGEGTDDVGEPREIVDAPVPGFPQLTWSAHATPDPTEATTLGHALQYRVDIEIAWKSGGEKKTRSYRTLLLREIPFGEKLRREFIEPKEPAPKSPAPPGK